MNRGLCELWVFECEDGDPIFVGLIRLRVVAIVMRCSRTLDLAFFVHSCMTRGIGDIGVWLRLDEIYRTRVKIG